MNVFNMFWAFISLVVGIILAAVSYWVLWPMTALFGTITNTAGVGSVQVATTSIMMYIAQAGIVTMVILFIFVFPIAIALDDEGKIVKALGLSQ